MNDMSNKEKLDGVFRDTLNVTQEQLKSVQIKVTPMWDSVGHMTLIAALEDTFDIMLDPEDMMDLTSYEKGVEILNRYGVEF